MFNIYNYNRIRIHLRERNIKEELIEDMIGYYVSRYGSEYVEYDYLVAGVRGLFKNKVASVRMNGKLCNWFSIDIGITQGSCMTRGCILLVVETELEKGNEVILALAHADNFIIFAESKK